MRLPSHVRFQVLTLGAVNEVSCHWWLTPMLHREVSTVQLVHCHYSAKHICIPPKQSCNQSSRLNATLSILQLSIQSSAWIELDNDKTSEYVLFLKNVLSMNIQSVKEGLGRKGLLTLLLNVKNTPSWSQSISPPCITFTILPSVHYIKKAADTNSWTVPPSPQTFYPNHHS